MIVIFNQRVICWTLTNINAAFKALLITFNFKLLTLTVLKSLTKQSLFYVKKDSLLSSRTIVLKFWVHNQSKREKYNNR